MGVLFRFQLCLQIFSLIDSSLWLRHCAAWVNLCVNEWLTIKRDSQTCDSQSDALQASLYSTYNLSGFKHLISQEPDLYSAPWTLAAETQLQDASQVTDVSIKVTHGKKYDHASRLIKTFSINEP